MNAAIVCLSVLFGLGCLFLLYLSHRYAERAAQLLRYAVDHARHDKKCARRRTLPSWCDCWVADAREWVGLDRWEDSK